MFMTILKKLKKLKYIFYPKILFKYLVVNKIFFNRKNPHYFPRLYDFCKQYVLFYQGDGNANRDTNGGWRFLRNYISIAKPKIIFDVGGHVGEYTLKINELDPSITIYAFEPNPNTFLSLVQNTKHKNGKIIPVNIAMSSKEGDVTLYIDPSKNAVDSLYFFDNDQYKHTASKQVHCSTVDAYCKDNNIDRIDMLKIDTEGNDLEVMKGASRMIGDGKIGIIQFEFGLLNTYSHSYLYDFSQFLNPFGYELYKIKPLGLDKVAYSEYERTIYAYFVAIKKEADINTVDLIRYKL